uniref:AlaDh_PNT_N domain-containing protein n=1 Tax=Parastrongyloides trichosuri TaxID=131310 RepID=A0A0N4ZZP0_PARTI
MEEQGLADRRLHRLRLEGLGDQEGRLGPLAGQQPLGEGGDEDHRHVEALEDVLDRINARRAVGQLDVGQDQTGTVLGDRIDRFVMGGGGAGDTVAQFANQTFDVGRDDGLVLNDQDVSGQFGVDVGLGLGDQAFDRTRINAEDLRRLGRGEAFQRGQQEGLARARRDPHQAARGVVAAFQTADVLELGAGGRPDGVEDVIKGHARRHVRRQLPLTGGQRLERDAHIVVARDLIAGQRPRVTTDVGQMRRQPGHEHLQRPAQTALGRRRRLQDRAGDADPSPARLRPHPDRRPDRGRRSGAGSHDEGLGRAGQLSDGHQHEGLDLHDPAQPVLFRKAPLLAPDPAGSGSRRADPGGGGRSRGARRPGRTASGPEDPARGTARSPDPGRRRRLRLRGGRRDLPVRRRHGEEPRVAGPQGPGGDAGAWRLWPRRQGRRRRHAIDPGRRRQAERRQAGLTTRGAVRPRMGIQAGPSQRPGHPLPHGIGHGRGPAAHPRAQRRPQARLRRDQSGGPRPVRPAVGAGVRPVVLGAAQSDRLLPAAAGGLAGGLPRRHAAVGADRHPLAGLSGAGGRHLCAGAVLGAPGPGRARPRRNPHPGPHPGLAGRQHHHPRQGPAGLAGREGRADARDPPPGEEQPADHLVPAVDAAKGSGRPGGARGPGRHPPADHRPGPDLSHPLSERGHPRGGLAHLPDRTGRSTGSGRGHARAAGDQFGRGRRHHHRPGSAGARRPVAGRGRVQRPEARLRRARRRPAGPLQGHGRNQRAGGPGRRSRHGRPRRHRGRPHPDERLRQATARPGRNGRGARRRLHRPADLRHARSGQALGRAVSLTGTRPAPWRADHAQTVRTCRRRRPSDHRRLQHHRRRRQGHPGRWLCRRRRRQGRQELETCLTLAARRAARVFSVLNPQVSSSPVPGTGLASARSQQSGQIRTRPMRVGVPREIKTNEHRVGLTPTAAREYVAHGHEVRIETGAGLGAGFSDADYKKAGATIVADAETVFADSDMIVKERRPAPAGAHVRSRGAHRRLFRRRDPVEAQRRHGPAVLRRAGRGAGQGAGPGRRGRGVERRAHGHGSGRRGGGAGALHPPDARDRRTDRRAGHHPLFLDRGHRGGTGQGRRGDRGGAGPRGRGPHPGPSRPAEVDEAGQRPDRRGHRSGRLFRDVQTDDA